MEQLEHALLCILRAVFFLFQGVRIGWISFDGIHVGERASRKGGEVSEAREHESNERRSRD